MRRFADNVMEKFRIYAVGRVEKTLEKLHDSAAECSGIVRRHKGVPPDKNALQNNKRKKEPESAIFYPHRFTPCYNTDSDSGRTGNSSLFPRCW